MSAGAGTGVRNEQRIEIWRDMELLPTQRRFRHSQSKYRLYSSGYGGGKSKLGCRESIDYALRFDHSRHVVSRFHYPDLKDTTMETYWREVREIGLSDGSEPGPRHYIWRASDMAITWFNRSVTLFRNLDDPTGAKFGSLETSTWFVDEGSEVDDHVYQTIFPSRLRWHLPGCDWQSSTREQAIFRARTGAGMDPRDAKALIECSCPRRGWVCTNPGPSGYLRRARRGDLAGWECFDASPAENIYAGPEYHADMAELGKQYGEVWFAMYVNGSWDAFEGQRFTMLSRDTHVWHDAPTSYPGREWEVYEGHDFGFRVAHAVVWLCVHKSREWPIVIEADYEEAYRETPEIARDVKRIRGTRGWNPLTCGDPAGMSAHTGTGVSDIALFGAQGLDITPARWARDPAPRADLLALLFSKRIRTRTGEMPAMVFSPRAERTLERCIGYRFADPSRTGVDAPEKFHKRDDHLVDALGYAASYVPDPLELTAPGGPSEAWQRVERERRLPTMDELDRRSWQRPSLGW